MKAFWHGTGDARFMQVAGRSHRVRTRIDHLVEFSYTAQVKIGTWPS